MQETRVQSLGLGKISWRRKWQPTPVLLSGKSHGWRNLVGYSHGIAESDTTEQPHSLTIGKHVYDGLYVLGYTKGYNFFLPLQSLRRFPMTCIIFYFKAYLIIRVFSFFPIL